jgi:hypothetical protein
MVKDTPYGYVEGLSRSGTHVWFREDGQWEHQHPDEGGSMLCGPTYASPREAWAALVERGPLTGAFAHAPHRLFGRDVRVECIYPIHPCEACVARSEAASAPDSFPLVFSLASNPDGVIAAERALADLADALGRERPGRFVWHALREGADELELALLMRLVGVDRPATARERLVHIHGKAGFHPEWPAHLGHGAAPRTAVEDALLAHRVGGLAAIADDGTARHRALRALLTTGFGIPCDLDLAVATGTLLAAQPFDLREDDHRWDDER